MSRLLFVYERDMPTVSVMRDIFAHIHDERIVSTFSCLLDIKPEDINNHDVLVFMRPSNIYSWKLARDARKAGHVTVTFCDDDLLNLPDTTPMMPWRKKGLEKCLNQSDVIWSSSRHITEKYCSMTAGKRCAVSDTVIQPEEIDDIETFDNKKVKIVYEAAPNHTALYEKYIAPVMPRIASEHDVSMTFVSVHPEEPGCSCEYVPGMPLLKYRKYMKEQHFDIGLAPIHNDEFSKCKYFNKFIEYTTQGIVGIYSNTEPYTYVVKNGVNGFLANDEPESWYEALNEAIKNSELRKSCVQNAAEYLKTQHSEKACLERIIQGLPEIIGKEKEYKKCKEFRYQKMFYYLSRPFDWMYLSTYYLKRTGIRAVINRTKTHFTEAKAYSRKHK